MSSESARLRVSVDIHGHGKPADGGRGEDVGGMDFGDGEEGGELGRNAGGRLWRENGLVMYQDGGMECPESVRLVWARPLSGRGGAVSVVKSSKKREVAYIPDLGVLPEDSRRIAEEELRAGVVMPVIREIIRVHPRFGNFYWEVETDMGRRRFLLLSPESNTFRPSADSVMLRDVSGNCYEISSISELSVSSRREMERVL